LTNQIEFRFLLGFRVKKHFIISLNINPIIDFEYNSTKPCKYFKQGQGECPFAGACFYLHAYPDGRKAEMPPPRQRRRQNHDGELETLRVLIDILIFN
jgi:hypothetical protein